VSSAENGQTDGTGRLLAGRYRVLAQLGRGGMGVVWRAVDEVLGREVAVKELRTYTDADAPELADLRLRMQREARAAARVRHPGVVAVHDIAEVDGRPLIVMELIDGPSLDDVLGERGPIGPREAAEIGAKVLDALAAAHRVGVLHRDVKPGNILLDRSGRVVLTDFGIATMEDPGDGSATHLTRSGELVGSLDYLAPERAQGADPGPASDIWALGATLYASVEGASPFRRTSTYSTLTAIVSEPLPDPRRSGPLGPVLRQLLDKRPEFRPDADRARGLLEAVAGDGAPGVDRPTATLTQGPGVAGRSGSDAQPSGEAGQPGSGGAAGQPGSGGAAGRPGSDAQGPGSADRSAPVPEDLGAPGSAPVPEGFGVSGSADVPQGLGAPGSAPVPEGFGVSGSADVPQGLGMPGSAPVPEGFGVSGSADVPQGLGMPGSSPVPQGFGPPGSAPAPHASAPTGPMTPSTPPRRKKRVLIVAAVVGVVVLGGAGVTFALLDNSDGTPVASHATSSSARGAGSSAPTGRTETDRSGGPKPTGQGDERTSAPTKSPSGKGGTTSASRAPAPTPVKSSGGGAAGGGATTGGDTPSPSPAPSCQSVGGGKYDCQVWRTAKSYTASGTEAGVLDAGVNYFYCQQNLGRRETYGQWTNVWWAKTDDDSGNTNVYVSDVYIKGGDNDEPVPGLPVC
jgi:tRNA A-37 threonylcarbamoyl transferase component Bud32